MFGVILGHNFLGKIFTIVALWYIMYARVFIKLVGRKKYARTRK